MTPRQARQDYDRLIAEYKTKFAEYLAAYEKLSERDRLRADFFHFVPGLPERPRHPSFTRIHETPHPHFARIRAQQGYVWAKGLGWMRREECEDLLQWADESG